jgi:hypothetical protein
VSLDTVLVRFVAAEVLFCGEVNLLLYNESLDYKTGVPEY